MGVLCSCFVLVLLFVVVLLCGASADALGAVHDAYLGSDSGAGA
jgi:hypothetical protein